MPSYSAEILIREGSHQNNANGKTILTNTNTNTNLTISKQKQSPL